MHFETVNSGDVRYFYMRRRILWINLEEKMRKRGAEEGAVDGTVSGQPWHVDVLTTRTKHLDCVATGAIGFSNRQHGLERTRDERTSAELSVLIFF